MTRRTHIFFGVVLCCLFVLPIIGAVAAQSSTTPATPAPQQVVFGLKDLISLGVLLASIVSAVWFLASRIGKIESRVASLETSMVSQQRKLEEIASNQREASIARKEMWKEINRMRERLSVMETVCEQRHSNTTKSGALPTIPPPNQT